MRGNSLEELWGLSPGFAKALSYSWSFDKVTLAQTMRHGPPVMASCDCSFRNESLDMMIEAVNQLMSLASIGMIDQSSFMGRTVKLNE